MKCALCEFNEANKKNTHYLTDGIIRSCLNQDGSGEREKGFYFEMSNKTAFIDFNFQRETTIEKIEDSLGREPTEEEIEKAKKIPFSVDFIFCNECENTFSEIENIFIKHLLPRFRNTDLNKVRTIEFTERKEVRLFFYLQIWRTHICETTLSLSSEIAEKLREIILNSKTIDLSELNQFPLSITYLQTTGDLKEYTTNFVGFTNDKNPYLIFMNDFVIQFFESRDVIRYFDFHGLNNKADYISYVNYKEESFIVPVFQNVERKQFQNTFVKAEKVKQTLDFYKNSFKEVWFKTFGDYPTNQNVAEYINEIVKDDFEVVKYSRERIKKLTYEFITRKLK